MEKISGKIKAIKQRTKNYSILVNNIWLSDFGKCPVEKNDYVNIDYELKGSYKNITKIEKTEPEDQPEETEQPLKSADEFENKRNIEILRGQCFNNSCTILSGKYMGGMAVLTNEIFDLTKKLFEKAKEVKFLEWK